MKNIILFLFLSLPVIGMGQINDCNVQITTDEYTKQKTIETEYQTINNGKYKFTVDGNNIYMYLRLDQPSAFTVYKTDTLYMLFDDKEILKYYYPGTTIEKREP